MTDEELDQLEALMAKASPGEWKWGLNPFTIASNAVDWFQEMISKRKGWDMHSVFVVDPEDKNHSLMIAVTGNGPTSEANARFILAAAQALPTLIKEVRRARQLKIVNGGRHG